MHAGKLIAKALKKSGVECVFTLSGGHIMPIYDGCLDEGIRIIDVRHEQATIIANHAENFWEPFIGCRPITHDDREISGYERI